MFWYLTRHEKFLQAPWYNVFQHKILWFRFVSVSAESFGQIFSFGFGIGPKPKRWFRSYTTARLFSDDDCRVWQTHLVSYHFKDQNNAPRYAASRSLDLADMRFWIGSENVVIQRFFAAFECIFWCFPTSRNAVFWYKVFFQEPWTA